MYSVAPITTNLAQSLPGEYEGLLEYTPSNFKVDQGNVGTCVGWDTSFVLETQGTIIVKSRPGLFTASLYDLSAGWVYEYSRRYSLPPVPDGVEGSTNLGACRAVNKVGVAREYDIPTDVAAPWDGIGEINDEVANAAMGFRVSSYHNVPSDPSTVKAAIYGEAFPLPYKMPDGSPGKTPIMSAYPIHQSFRDAYDDGIVSNPLPDDRLLGGHSSMLVGWKIIDGKEYYINFNSWGTEVGDEGLFYIPTDYPFYPNDFWLLTLIDTVPSPKTTTILESSHWMEGVANIFAQSPNKFYYGREVQ